MPPGRDSFRRNRVAPLSTFLFYHFPQSNSSAKTLWAVSSQLPPDSTLAANRSSAFASNLLALRVLRLPPGKRGVPLLHLSSPAEVWQCSQSSFHLEFAHGPDMCSSLPRPFSSHPRLPANSVRRPYADEYPRTDKRRGHLRFWPRTVPLQNGSCHLPSPKKKSCAPVRPTFATRCAWSRVCKSHRLMPAVGPSVFGGSTVASATKCW
jgi:hypothetical protein